MIEIYLIRHGKSLANEHHIFGMDYPLSHTGVDQAVSAKERYDTSSFDDVYSSKLIRARETATYLFGLPVPADHQFSEFNEIWFGNAEEKQYGEHGIEGYTDQFEDNFAAFMKECMGDDPYERADEAISKVRKLVNDISNDPKAYPNRKIAVISSDTLMRCMVLNIMNKGHDWSRITVLPSINNLDHIEMTFSDGPETELIGMKMPGQNI